MSDTSKHPANRLAGETSPYLLQHAHNPVDWFPWGPEALARARAEDRPIFLSIGYSACHWCHVMERESFENPDIAALMNERYVNIKVDREERPDLDNLYMAAVQALTGHGGWPMSVFLTPDLEPFYGGTYYPPTDSRGMPGFPRVLLSVERAWKERRGEIITAAAEMAGQLRAAGERSPGSDGALDARLLDNASRALARAFEPIHGGFGNAPKFPHPMDLRVLLRQHARTGDAHALHMATHTLDKMSRGGIYDHLGGGFARYSTDDRWLAPHFEKMLYDNALLSTVYLEAYQVTRDPEYARVARETMDYILGRMTSPEGPFYSTEDADSEGRRRQVLRLVPRRDRRHPRPRAGQGVRLRPRRHRARQLGAREHPQPPQADPPGRQAPRPRRGRLEERPRRRPGPNCWPPAKERIPPAKDTKVLTSWNGLMLAPLAEGSLILDEPRYAEAARQAAGFLLDEMRTPDGRLLHSYKDGQAKFNAYLDDYANLIDGLTRLFEATGEARWIEAAVDLARVMVEEFHDAEKGGFFYVGKGHEALIARQKDAYDNATPSGNAMAATSLARLAALTGRDDFDSLARSTLQAVHLVMEKAPTAAGQSLIVLDDLLAPSQEFAVIAGNDPLEFREALLAIHEKFLPHKVVAPSPTGEVADGLAEVVELLKDRPARDGKVTTFICENFACQDPVVGVEPLRAALEAR